MNQTHCKTCEHILDANEALDGDRQPKEKDISVCAYCGTISEFDADLNLRALSDEECQELRKNDREIWQDVLAIQGMILSHIVKN
jgi:NAD-dependent SIR2 family protein deacetylase